MIFEQQQHIASLIIQYWPMEFLIFVGSFAKGTEHANSDLDIIYYTTQEIPFSVQTKMIEDLKLYVQRDVDLINFL